MGGFGTGPFGTEAFGEWKWSRAVLYDLIPQLYRNEDDKGLLRLYLESQRPSFDGVRHLIRQFSDLRDPLSVRTRYDVTRVLRLGYRIIFRGTLEQRGVDGSVSAIHEFRSATARFQPEDRGKELTTSGSTVIGNNRSVLISGVVNASTVLTEPPLSADAGLLRWELRTTAKAPQDRVICKVQFGDVSDVSPGWLLTSHGAVYTVLARRLFQKPTSERKLLTDREGIDGVIDSQGRFQSASIRLTQADVGKWLTIYDSSIEISKYFEIFAVDQVAPNDFRAILTRLLIRGADSDGGVVYALLPGVINVQVQHLRQGLNTPALCTVVGTKIIVQLATDKFGVVVTTAAQVVLLVQGNVKANALVRVFATGSGGGLAGEHAATAVPGIGIAADGGPLSWALLPFPEVELAGQTFPDGVIDRGGDDLIVSASAPGSSNLTSTLGVFVNSDVGGLITIRGSLLGNDGTFLIVSILAANVVVVQATLTVETLPLTWELRRSTGIGDNTQVEVAAPALISLLAKDFGIDVDERENELRQRSWVRNITRWVDIKGTAKAYEIIGAISGFNVSVKGLYRVTQDLLDVFPNPDRYEVGESAAGRSGTDGTFLAPGILRFFAASAKFQGTDIGRQIRIRGAAVVGNNKLYTIARIINSQTVEFRALDTVTLPEANNGALIWAIIRLYTDLPPLLPLFDEVNADRMEVLIDGLPPQLSNHWGIDKYCWEKDWSSKIGVGGYGGVVTIIGVAPFAPTVWAVGATGDVNVITWVGHWRLIDAAGNIFYVETLPILFFVTWFFTVTSNLAPVAGPATLEYVCSIQLTCEYCAASKVLATIQTGDIALEGGVAIEKVLERVVDRLKLEVTPAHVELIAVFQQNIVARFRLRVTITRI